MENQSSCETNDNSAENTLVDNAAMHEYVEEATDEIPVNTSFENTENQEVQDFPSDVQEEDYTLVGEEEPNVIDASQEVSEDTLNTSEVVAALHEDIVTDDVYESNPEEFTIASEEHASDIGENETVMDIDGNQSAANQHDEISSHEIDRESEGVSLTAGNEEMVESHDAVGDDPPEYADDTIIEPDQVVEHELSHEESFVDSQHDSYEEVQHEAHVLEESVQDEAEDIKDSPASDFTSDMQNVEEKQYGNEEVINTDLMTDAEALSNAPQRSDEAAGDVGSNEVTVESSKIDDENEYEEAVEVEEKEEEGHAEENVAQHVSDSDDEHDVGEDVDTDGVKLGHVSDDDVRDSDDESGEQKDSKAAASQEAVAKMLDSDSDEEDARKKEGVGDLILDIFGDSENDDEEFAGFGEEDVSKANKAQGAIISDSDVEEEEDDEPAMQKTIEKEESDDEDEGARDKGSGMVYDFDIMMQKKKAERKGRRKRDGGTYINDSDDIIGAMLTKMKEAADADREANQSRKPALHKLKMFPSVVSHLKKQDLKEAFVDMGMVAAIADWLSLLPDKSLPHLSIRTELLRVLHDLPPVSEETLKSSGIGRSVMILFKHPRETRQNRDSAGRLINKWSRPIFGLNDNFKSMSRGEREQRDLEQMPQAKRRRLSTGQNEAAREASQADPEQEPLRPGDKGFVMRARVPVPSHKDYVVRPKWNIEGGDDDEDQMQFRKRGKGKSRKDARLEKHIKNFAERKKNNKMQRAVGISIQGNKMPLA